MISAAQVAKVLFFDMRPERVIRTYAQRSEFNSDEDEFIDGYGMVRFEVFERAAASVIPNLSHEELLGLYGIMRQAVLERRQLVREGRLFAPLLFAGDRYLTFDDDVYYKFERSLEWRDVSLVLGQDVITTAALAWRDRYSQNKSRRFDWAPMLSPDRVELRRFISKGLVENHSHLKGASQSFAVTLAYCANHLQAWDLIEDIIRRGLVSRPHFDATDNAEPWRMRLCRLASLRITLFLRVLRGRVPYNYGVSWSLTEYEVERLIDLTRFQHGLVVDEGDAPLDYALHDGLADYTDSPHRLLIAERALLYNCFREVFAGTFSMEECVGLYAYLLLKAQLRGEFIQVNNRFGFDNFLRYENRKDLAFDADASYVREQNRIAVRGAFECSVDGMEARLVPGFTAQQCREKMDKVLNAVHLQRNDPPFFFVFHFIKGLDKERVETLFERNHEVRERAWVQAEALAQMFAEEPERKEWVLGIDAASTEIGCRPEVFAPAFGYLRGWVNHLFRDKPSIRFDRIPSTPWRTTYHAGEDFHDLVDGIRAVDEALRFLRMQRGDRIGHGLAAGVDPEVHARNKGGRSIVSKQDELDNDIWLLRFANEEGVAIDSQLRYHLEHEAMQLMIELYGVGGSTVMGNFISTSDLECYARSWLLREDPPSWYRGGGFAPQRLIKRDWPETDGMEREGDTELALARRDPDAVLYYSRYHWDPVVRERGSQMVENILRDDYLRLVRDVQDALLSKMARMGIVIECNPSSNCVIGSFRDYVQHPIFRMMDIRSNGVSGDRLVVTVNTDDVGVFDTTLQNEYVLLAAAMAERDKRGGGSLEDNMDRLEMLRRNGYLYSFSEQIQTRYR